MKYFNISNVEAKRELTIMCGTNKSSLSFEKKLKKKVREVGWLYTLTTVVSSLLSLSITTLIGLGLLLCFSIMHISKKLGRSNGSECQQPAMMFLTTRGRSRGSSGRRPPKTPEIIPVRGPLRVSRGIIQLAPVTSFGGLHFVFDLRNKITRPCRMGHGR